MSSDSNKQQQEQPQEEQQQEQEPEAETTAAEAAAKTKAKAEAKAAAKAAASEVKRYRCKAPCRYKNKAWAEGDILTVIGPAAVPSYFEPA